MPLPKAASKLLFSGFLPGILGGLLAFAASNVWFYYFGAYLLPSLPGRQLLPDFFAYFQIDVYVGAGCGYAGTISGPRLAELFGGLPALARAIPILYSVLLGLGISLIVNGLLLFMSII